MNTQTLPSSILKEKSTASSLKPPTHSFSPHPTPRKEYFQFLIWLELLKSDPDAGRDWGQEEKGMIEDEMVGWYHRLDGHEFEQAPRVGDGQGSLVAVDHGIAKSQTQLSNWTELNWLKFVFDYLKFVETELQSMDSLCFMSLIQYFICKNSPALWLAVIYFHWGLVFHCLAIHTYI